VLLSLVGLELLLGVVVFGVVALTLVLFAPEGSPAEAFASVLLLVGIEVAELLGLVAVLFGAAVLFGMAAEAFASVLLLVGIVIPAVLLGLIALGVVVELDGKQFLC
jgi:hypothetical protein